MAYSKLGLHRAPGGSANGIGDVYRDLASRGIPLRVKSADAMGPINEVLQIADEYGVPSVSIFRLTTHGQEHDDGNGGFVEYDVPMYQLSAEDAANEHWGRTLDRLPSDFNPDRTWLELINEVDHERSAWLGEFAVHCAHLALESGYKISMFGWSGGEPEPEDWQHSSMLEYLRLCGQHRDRLAVSIHEYSLTTDGIMVDYPYHVGRFQLLFRICDLNGLRRPTTHITELGWTHTNIPPTDDAMSQLVQCDELYAPYPEIEGGFVWYSGPGFNGIAAKVERVIPHLHQHILNWRADDPVDNQPVYWPDDVGDPNDGGEPSPNTKEIETYRCVREQYHRVYLLLSPRMGVEWAEMAASALYGSGLRWTLTNSADDAAVRSDSNNTRIVALNAADWNGTVRGLFDFYAANYGLNEDDGFRLDTWAVSTPDDLFARIYQEAGEPPPPDGGGDVSLPPLGTLLGFGLHGPANPTVTPQVLDVFRDVNPTLLKVLTTIDKSGLRQLSSRIHANTAVIIRPYVSFWDGFHDQPRSITPEQFFNWTHTDILECVSRLGGYDNREFFIELHNEPNLRGEGLGASWNSGVGFAQWMIKLLALYKAAFPRFKFMFPGLSPGPTINGVRQGSQSFLLEAKAAVMASDCVGAHVYWAHDWPVQDSLVELDWMISTLGSWNHPGRIYVTEASNNKGVVDDVTKGEEYVDFAQALSSRERLGGVTFFVVSDQGGEFPHETWVDRPGLVGVVKSRSSWLPL